MHSAHAVVRQRRVFFYPQVETTVRVNAAAIVAAAADEKSRDKTGVNTETEATKDHSS